jgi:putative sporulation protein YyaC
MKSNLIVSVHYTHKQAGSILTQAFLECFTELNQAPAFICIGSDRHLLDCLGPLTGTMLEEHNHNIMVLGTLQEPWHAGNISSNLRAFKNNFPSKPIVAIDASIGEDEAPGLIKVKRGSLKPGKAVHKNLPVIGDFAVTALVGNRAGKLGFNTVNKISLAHVYGMSRVISDAILDWDRQKQASLE